MAIIIGNNASETINGTAQGDIILAGNGDDTVNGGNGIDIIDAGNGNDTVDGGAGSDLIDGGNGNDTLNGGSGIDIINGDNGNDTIDGGSDSDLVTGGAGNDILIYKASENVNAIDIYDGGSGQDKLRLVVSQALFNSALFQSDLAKLQAKLAGGSASYIFKSIDLTVTSIEQLQVIIEGGPANQGPTAVNDTVSATEDNAITISAASLLANDTDPNAGDTKTLVSVQSPVNGTVSIVSGNVVFVPAANFSGTASFTYTMRDTAGATSTATVTVNVAAANDAPVAVADTAAAVEDTPITITAASLLANDTDIDLGDGKVLVSVQSPVNGTVSIVGGDVVFVPASDFSGVASFTYTMRDTAGATSTATVTVNVAAVADAPTLTVAPASGNEDSAIALSISAAITDGSEHISSLTIGGAPDGAMLSDGMPGHSVTVSGGSPVEIVGWNLASLTIKPPANSDADFTLTVTATSQDGVGGPTASTSDTILVSVNAVADAPNVTTAPASGTTDAPIALSIAVTLADPSETLGDTVTIEGVPSSFALNHGTPTDDSGWLVARADLADLKLVPINGIATPGDITLQVTATSADGAGIASTTATLTVSVAAGATQHSGRVVDGYIVGATVFADANGNGQLDTGEAFTTTAADGTFTLTGGDGDLVMFGGTDVSTGVAFTGTMKAPEGSSVVTPLTTLVAELVASTGSVAAAQDAVAAAFGFDPSIDLQTYDPVPAAILGDETATAILAAAIQVQSTVSQVSAVAGASADVIGAIATAITAPPAGGFNLGNTETVSAIAFDSGVSATALSTVTEVVAAANGSIQSATDVTELAQAATVAQGDATAALAATDFEDDEAVEALTGTFVDDLANQVDNAEIGDVDGPLFGTFGNDTLLGTAGADAIDGLDGDDTIDGLGGHDILYGGIGRDRLTGGAGDDTIDGGVGFDSAFYSDATGAIVANLATRTVTGDGVGTDTLIGIEEIRGSIYNDTLNGSLTTGPNTEQFEGWGGDDTINGNGGFDRVRYDNQNTGALGIQVNLAAGIITGRDAAATAVVGTDTLTSIEAVRGSHSDDIFNAAGFAASGLNANNGGDQGNFNEFEGMGGNDTITGNNNTRISYANATGAVTVTMTSFVSGGGTGVADGNGSVGHDTFTGVNGIRGSNFNDSLTGSNNGNNVTENFEGWGGNDTITGGGGFDRARYDNNSTFNSGVPLVLGLLINMNTGAVTGRDAYATAIFGADTLVGIESVRGSYADDIYDAFSLTSASLNKNDAGVSPNLNFNEFEGWGGNDTITGNGNTRITFVGASEGVTVNLSTGSVIGGASVGTDTITGGVNQVRGSEFVDIITGTGGNDTLDGRGGNDTINGGGSNDTILGQAGDDTLNGDAGNDTITGGAGNDTIDGGNNIDIAVFSGLRSEYGITPGANPGASQIVDSNGSRDGTDTVTNVELLEFSNAYQMNQRVLDISTFGLIAGKQILGTGLAAGDNLTVGANGNSRFIDLGGGTDTLTLTAGPAYFLNLANVENIAGSGGNDSVQLQNVSNGMFVDLGFGSDVLTLGPGNNSVTVQNVEAVNGLGGSNTVTMAAFGSISITFVQAVIGSSGFDTVTMTGNATVTNVESVRGSPGSETLTLGSATPITVNGIENVIGTTSGDQVTVTTDPGPGAANVSLNLGDGSDTVTLNVFGVSAINLGLTGVETVNSIGGNDTVNMMNAQTGVSIDLGGGTDQLNLANGGNSLTVLGIETVNGGMGIDTLTLGAPGTISMNFIENVIGSTGIDFVTFSGSATMTDVEFAHGNAAGFDTLTMGSSGTLSVIDVETVNGSAGADQVTLAADPFPPVGPYNATFNLGGDNDTVILGIFGTPSINLGLNGVETVTSVGGIETVNLQNVASGLSIDLGTGFDTLNLANGNNTATVSNVETINAFGPGNDNITAILGPLLSNQSFNLGFGTDTLTLAGASGNFSISVAGSNLTVVGATSAVDEHINLLNVQVSGATFDLGAGTDDSLTLFGQSGFFNTVTVKDVETVIGSNFSDTITIADAPGSNVTTVTGGLEGDTMTASADEDHFRFVSTGDSSYTGNRDIVADFGTEDVFVFEGISGPTGFVGDHIEFIGTDAFHVGAATSEARLNGNLLEIDVDANGVMDANDMAINLNNLNGTLTNANFLLI